MLTWYTTGAHPALAQSREVPAPVVVVVFSNITGDEVDDWIGAGIAETVAFGLNSVDGLTVLPTTDPVEVGTRAASDTESPIAIAQALDARWVVSGAYQRLGDELRITARVTDVSTSNVLQSMAVDGLVGDLFALQDQLVAEVRTAFESQRDRLVVDAPRAQERAPTPPRPPASEPRSRPESAPEPSGASDGPSLPDWLTGYFQTVPLFTADSSFAASNISDVNRMRLTITPAWGPFAVEASYEHAITVTQRRAAGGLGIGAIQSSDEWLGLQGTITRTNAEHVRWRHRFDRLNVRWSPSRSMDLSVGRQAISWGTTLFLSPADPFLPFLPSDPFRQFRGGIDAARLRFYPGPLSTIDFVVRPTNTMVGEEFTALGRGLTTWRNWEISGWGGTLYGDVTGAVGVTGAIGGWGLRLEGVVRELEGIVVGRGAVGLDRLLQIGSRDLFVVVEYQHDGLGAATPDDYLQILQSDEFQRGELQVLGRDEAVVQASFQVSPLWSVGGLGMWNLNDGSALVSPSLNYSAGNETSIGGGLYFGFGNDEPTLARPIPSEHGLTAPTAYLSLSWYF